MTTPPPTPRPAGPGIPLVAGARLPLSFIVFGLGALALAVALLARAPAQLLLPHVHPHVAALAHLWLPGFLLSVCIGAVYQLMPVVLGAPLRLPIAAAWTHLALHAAGVALLVGGFRAARFEFVGLGGGCVSGGVAILLVAAWRTFQVSARRDAVGWSFPVAVSWLAATVLAGVLLAVNRRAPFLPWSVLDLLEAHAHLGLAGFFLTLLQGATFQLVPMFTLATPRLPGCVRAGLILTPIGLTTLAVGLAFGWNLVAIVGGATMAAAIGCSGAALVATLRTRRLKKLEPGLQAFRLGAMLVVPAVLAGAALLFGGVEAAWTLPAAVAYGLTIIAGALSFMVLGMLCKIVPFLVWMRVYGPRAGRQPVPLATSLGSRRIERAWLALHASALVVLVAGVFISSALLVQLGAVLLAAAVLAFLFNTARTLAHLFRPQLRAAAPSPAPRTASAGTLVRP